MGWANANQTAELVASGPIEICSAIAPLCGLGARAKLTQLSRAPLEALGMLAVYRLYLTAAAAFTKPAP